MSTHLDRDGQPLIRAFRGQAVAERKLDELIGIVKGVLADGVVSQGEAEFLLQWLEANREVAAIWPANVIYPRLAEALADGVLDLREEGELLELLLQTVGGNKAPSQGDASDSTMLPLTRPAPAVVFPDRSFCFTGKFFSGTRDWCRRQVHERGGFPAEAITKKLHYLVIGEIGSRDWLHSTYGTKIQKAVSHASTGAPLAIVSEEHWVKHLG
ncbi:BRCT domain-containing protein [Caballeronia sp. LZ034LL]|uniref:BRCT domain-containing protein n=1 Tax=Caballeronia sp. LZ034LL TaxID=3038567 RepID=UPI00285E0F19|nr:BRCT domain-containing protein [Caballeronia sp. LZ034LL]MDR5836610.1 BRCT domain-containing protein [Caballeronia sp. LZ034LL]